jgi:hypothetical protein
MCCGNKRYGGSTFSNANDIIASIAYSVQMYHFGSKYFDNILVWGLCGVSVYIIYKKEWLGITNPELVLGCGALAFLIGYMHMI